MVPVKQTSPAVRVVVIIITITLVRAVFTPMLSAASSPAPSILTSHAFHISSGTKHISTIAAGITCDQDARARVPTPHIIAACTVVGEEMNCINPWNAPNRYNIPIPARTIVSGVARRKRVNNIITNVGINAKKNEHPTRRYSLTTAPSAKNSANEAPKDAPAAIPNVKGLASGFFKVPCIIVPAAASPNPTRIANVIRGSLRSQTLSSPNVSVDRP
jgi:hypothetical protein